MLSQEKAIGDYTQSSKKIPSEVRQQMVLLIEDLHYEKQYKLETLYQAVALVDKYFKRIKVRNKKKLDIVNIAVTSLLMAAKIEEAIFTSFNNYFILHGLFRWGGKQSISVVYSICNFFIVLLAGIIRHIFPDK